VSPGGPAFHSADITPQMGGPFLRGSCEVAGTTAFHRIGRAAQPVSPPTVVLPNGQMTIIRDQATAEKVGGRPSLSLLRHPPQMGGQFLRGLCEGAGTTDACGDGLMPLHRDTKFPPNPHSPAPDQPRPEDRNDNCSSPNSTRTLKAKLLNLVARRKIARETQAMLNAMKDVIETAFRDRR
jgi:hypothetical protein